MGNAYNNASLLVTPNGYKASKIYSAKPTDGTGDLAFSRASNATRVNSAGLIEKVRENIYPNGSALVTTGWITQGATLTAGQADPNGAATALRVQLAAGATNYIYYAAATTSGLSLTRSVFIKAATAQTIRFEDPSGVGGVTLNLTTSYQRYTLSLPASGGGTYGIYLDNSIDTAAKDFTIAFVQIETGDIATDYIPTTTAAVSVGITANIPRLDYTGGGCPSWLLEPQRTNLVTFSEQFNNDSWTKGGATISANTSATLDPSGYNGSDKLVEDSSTGVHRVFNNSSVTISDSVATTYSVFAKAAERTQIYLRDNDIVGARFNLSTGAVISTEGTATATITNYGNGWYRCTITRVSSNTSGRVIVYLDNGGDSYTGNGTSGVYIFGAQIETSAAYATSYIPTLGSSVTRLADAASKTASLLNQTNFSIFFDYKAINGEGGSAPIFGFTETTGNNLEFYVNNESGLNVYVDLGGGYIFGTSSNAGFTIGSQSKVLVTYNGTTLKYFINGVLYGSAASSLPYLSRSLFLFSNKVTLTKTIAFYPTALSDSEAIQLTTL